MAARRLLVVDDSELVRTRIRRALEARAPAVLGRVDFAASFAEAAALDPSRYLRALLDRDLGDGDGATLATRFLAAAPPVTPAPLRIAFFTSEAATPGALAALGAHFSKPDDLHRAVGWLLGDDDDATVVADASDE